MYALLLFIYFSLNQLTTNWSHEITTVIAQPFFEQFNGSEFVSRWYKNLSFTL